MIEEGFITKIIAITTAVAGGVAKEMQKYLRENQPKMVISRIIAQMVVSGFSGLLAFEIVSVWSPEYSVIAAAIGGYYGGSFVDLVGENLIGYIRYRERK